MIKAIIDVVIPAYNEEKSVGRVISDIPKDIVRHIVVGNNGSTDNTAAVAKSEGSIVVNEEIKGYGNACLAALSWIADQAIHPDIIVFMDGDYSDHPEQLIALVQPILENDYQLVIGSRALGKRDKNSMTVPQVFGNWLATNLIRIIYGLKFTDLGPFRAIKYDDLMQLNMKDRDFGWTVEMQVKAARLKYKCTEIPVDYRARIGTSKVSGTIKGTIMAGYKILWTIFKLAIKK
jgi:glycosyltransferase involved in cell wall biosynthesis